MANNNWGKLVRASGGSVSEIIPETIMLFDQKNFFGRVPNADANKFSHCQQFVIPLPYLSSTHFSIEMKLSDADGGAIFLLTDHSRNGTFFRHKQSATVTTETKLEPIGASKSVTINDGDEIILMFRSEITVLYTFLKNDKADHFAQACPSIPKDSIPKDSIPKDSIPKDSIPKDSQSKDSLPKVSESQQSASKSPRKENKKPSTPAEGGSGVRLLKQQVASLQQENKEQEQRVAAIVASNTALTVDLNTKVRDLRTSHATLATKENELAAVTDSLRVIEANSAATEARVRILEDSSEELKAEISLLKSKAAALVEEVKYKTNQVENRDNLIADLSQGIAAEKALQVEAEGTIRDLQAVLVEAEVKKNRMFEANSALQDTLATSELKEKETAGKNKVLLSLLKSISNANAEATNKMKFKIEQLQHSMAVFQKDLQAIETLNDECTAGATLAMSTDLSKLESSMSYESDDEYSPMKNIENCEELDEDEADKQRRLSASPLAQRVFRRASRSRSPKPRQISDIETSHPIYESGKKRSYSGTQFASPDDVASPKRPYGSQVSGVNKESMTPWPKAFSTGSPLSDKGQNEGRGSGGQVGVTGSYETVVDASSARDRNGSQFTVTQTGLSDSESDSGGEEILDSGGDGVGGVRVEEHREVVEDVIVHLMPDIGDDCNKESAKGGVRDEDDDECMDVDAVHDVAKDKEDAMSEDKHLSPNPDAGEDGQGEAEEGQMSKDGLSDSIDVNGHDCDVDLEPVGGKVNGENGVVTSEMAAVTDRQTRASGSSLSPISTKSSQPAVLSLNEMPNISPSGGASPGISAKTHPIEFSSPRPDCPHSGIKTSDGKSKTTGITGEMKRSSLAKEQSNYSSQNDRDSALEGDSDKRSEDDRDCRDLCSEASRDVCDKDGEREGESPDRGYGVKDEEDGSSGSDDDQDEAGEVDELVESSSNDGSKIPTRNAKRYQDEGSDSQTAIAPDRSIEETFDTQAAYHNN